MLETPAWRGSAWLWRDAGLVFLHTIGIQQKSSWVTLDLWRWERQLTAVALLTNSLWPLLVMGGVFLAESLSVIIQVWVFKATKGPDGVGRRVFRMSPLHHHFELGGTPEQMVVPGFWIATAVLVTIGVIFRPI